MWGWKSGYKVNVSSFITRVTGGKFRNQAQPHERAFLATPTSAILYIPYKKIDRSSSTDTIVFVHPRDCLGVRQRICWLLLRSCWLVLKISMEFKPFKLTSLSPMELSHLDPHCPSGFCSCLTNTQQRLTVPEIVSQWRKANTAKYQKRKGYAGSSVRGG
jgi:hypothetical protein